MAENYWVQATVISIGDLQQIPYNDKFTGQPKTFRKFDVGCEVGGVAETYDGGERYYGQLIVGTTYTLEIQPDERYAHKIRGISPAGIITSPQATAQAAVPSRAPTPTPTAPKQPQTPLTPDLRTRATQYGWDVKNSHENATARANKLVDAVIAGVLSNDEDVAVTKIKAADYDKWIAHFVQMYWEEVLGERVPADAWGDLVEDQNPPAVEEPNA